MSKFTELWDRIRMANKPLSKSEASAKITLPVSELRRLMEKAFEEGARTRPKAPSIFESIFG